MNRGGAGARSLDIELHAALNPAGERKVERFGMMVGRGTPYMLGLSSCDGTPHSRS